MSTSFFILAVNMQVMKNLYEIYLRCGKVGTDTRSIEPGSLFFALKGENFDANQMVGEALAHGAGHVVTNNRLFEGDARVTCVDDPLLMLQELAAYHRAQLKIPVIGITGTNGKTTTKELVRQVLASHFKTYATGGNLNNHIGVPLTLLSIDSSYEMAVVEMGANHQGEIGFLCSIANPSHGLITNVGKAHLEGFGSFEGVKKTKGELYHHLKQNGGMVFINGGNQHLVEMLGSYEGTIFYGTDDTCFVSGKVVPGEDDFLNLEWRNRDGQSHHVTTQLLGAYNLENVLAAIAVALYFKVPVEKINDAIASYAPSNNRSQKMVTSRNTIFMDAYNANPSSLSLAIDNFRAAHGDQKLLILGGMKELGADSPQEHKTILHKLLEAGFGDVLLVGEEFFALENQFGQFKYFRNTADLCLHLEAIAPSDRVILVKGSRSNQLEKVLPYL